MLVYNHPVVRQGLIKLLENEQDIEICGEVNDVNTVLPEIDKRQPDVVVMDIFLEGTLDGLDVIKKIKKHCGNVSSLILSLLNEPAFALRAFEAGAKGFLTMNEAPEKIIEAIRSIAQGQFVFSSNFTGSNTTAGKDESILQKKST